ncbi:hypothetical protein BC834DRAFT_866123 [Gloeopeniophorella convolvens]|nr:hypothetical protein BC834DRAFT_866123 [Gloeopeniophorella convolvens]
MRYAALAIIASLPAVLSFSNTLPVVAWSSHRSSALDRLSSATHLNDIFGDILLDDDICKFDAVIMVDQPGLHASDLRSLASSSSIAMRLQDSPSSIQLPYAHLSPSAESMQDLAAAVAQRCGAQQLAFPVGAGPAEVASGSKHVVCMSMPAVTESAGARKRAVAEHESRLADELERIVRVFPRHLVLFAGSRRQDAPAPSPSPEGGILARYQLLTPALITSLLLVLFILVPVVLLGVSALASIQSPLRVQPPKGFNADEKKNQ